VVVGAAPHHRRRHLLLPARARARHGAHPPLPEAYDAVIGTYKNPIMGFGEVALVAAIVYHAFNGLRIIAVDLWPWATRHQRQLWWACWACGS
jgi:succinate dehydrogenase/fumarate reductase cytochrome b subunit